VQEIDVDYVVLNTPRGPVRLKNDFVLALIGYHPTTISCAAWASNFQPTSVVRCATQFRSKATFRNLRCRRHRCWIPHHEIFIENGRFHGRQIAEDLKKKLRLAS